MTAALAMALTGFTDDGFDFCEDDLITVHVSR